MRGLKWIGAWSEQHLKDEIDLSSCLNLSDVKYVIDNYIYFYNNHRFQWNRKKMTPVNYRNHLSQIL